MGRRVAVLHCQESSTRNLLCLLADDTELSVTPMIHGSTKMHESSPPTTLRSCVRYDTVFLKAELSNSRPPGYQQSSARCPSTPHFLHVLMSVELVLVVRFPLRGWFLHLPFLLPYVRESTCILSSSALVPFPDDAVGFAPKFREE